MFMKTTSFSRVTKPFLLNSFGMPFLQLKLIFISLTHNCFQKRKTILAGKKMWHWFCGMYLNDLF